MLSIIIYLQFIKHILFYVLGNLLSFIFAKAIDVMRNFDSLRLSETLSKLMRIT